MAVYAASSLNVRISAILPYLPGLPRNPIPPGYDELLEDDRPGNIGLKRIAMAKKARYSWLVFLDADAVYPKDYFYRIKRVITICEEVGLKGFRTRRYGGFGVLGNVEASLVVRKDEFLKRVEEYNPEYLDVGYLFEDLPVIDYVGYYHGLTKGERTALAMVSAFTITPLLVPGLHPLVKVACMSVLSGVLASVRP